tara:strand:+ start:1911 stop:2939 length:1029 start_codon:yes stop_codon:yes gene_type:complete
MQTNILGSFLNTPESMKIEYKEYCFKDNIVLRLLNQRQITDIIYRGCFPKKMNDIILYNIYKYFDIYVAKYISSFHNSVKQEDRMSFLIGVDDETEITGIPFKGDLRNFQGAFQTYVELLTRRDITPVCCTSVNVYVELCDIQSALLDDSVLVQQLKIQHQQQNHYRVVRRKYNKKRRQWNKAIMKYKGKLQDVFDDPVFQQEFEIFLKQRNIYSLFENYLKNSTFTVDLTKVKDYKQHKGTFIWWLIHFKDLKVDEWMKKKPKPPVFSKQMNAELCAITQLTPLRSRWIANNPALRYFVIRIEMNKDVCKQLISFIDPRKRNWRILKRYLANNEPRSMDLI